MSSVGRVLESERFTQVETATGSGRKITIKCGDKSKLRSKDIINLLDDEADDKETVKKEAKTPTKKAATTRTRRASVSCTTPAKTPTKKLKLKSKVAEIKKGRKSKVGSEEE